MAQTTAPATTGGLAPSDPRAPTHTTGPDSNPPGRAAGGLGARRPWWGRLGAMGATDQPLERIRAICRALPEVTERLSHGSPTFFVRDKKTFVMYLDDHHGDGRLALWCAAPVGAQAMLVEEEPERFFVPPYVGGRGWIGVRLDRDVDWDEIAGIAEDAYRMVAPKKLVAELDAEE